MATQTETNARTAIAVKLAEMKDLQNLLIANDQVLIQACPDNEITNRFEDLLRDDRKNLAIIESVIVQYGIKADATAKMRQQIEAVGEMMKDSETTFFEKVTSHELLKHTQALAGVLIHKAAQVSGADIILAIAPLNSVNFDNRGHEEQLKGVMESLSTLELTGKPADNSLWSRVQDTIAALTGIAGGIINRKGDEVTICDVIRFDHIKVNTLFAQIKANNEPKNLEELFGQIHQDLSTHFEAKEEMLYPAVRPYYADIQQLYDKQTAIKQMLNQIEGMSCDGNKLEYKAAVERLQDAVKTYIESEEQQLFPLIEAGFGDEQLKLLAVDFKAAKSKIQDQQAKTS